MYAIARIKNFIKQRKRKNYKKVMAPADEMEKHYKSLVKNIEKFQYSIKAQLKGKLTIRSLLIAMVTFISSLQVILNTEVQSDFQIYDTLSFQKSVLGGVTDGKIDKLTQLQSRLFTFLKVNLNFKKEYSSNKRFDVPAL